MGCPHCKSYNTEQDDVEYKNVGTPELEKISTHHCNRCEAEWEETSKTTVEIDIIKTGWEQ